MTKRDTSKPVPALPRSDTGPDEIQQQLALPEASPVTRMPAPEVTSQESPPSGARVFFPSNREDILLQLSSLALSIVSPPGVGITLVCEGGIAMLTDGLRVEEATLLSRGQPARFPVLAELRNTVWACPAAAVSISDVLSLRFRSQQEADDFRFRPVDEFDAGALPCVAEPSLFGLAGAPRFENRAAPMPEVQQRAQLADRIVAGVCHLLDLGDREPSCWHAVADMLCQGADTAELQSLTLRAALLPLAGAALPDSRQSRAVLHAFIGHARGSSRILVENVYDHLRSLPADAHNTQAEERWLEFAHAVRQNRIVLDGTLLSDTGSVPLRAALLAATVDNIDALLAFLHTDKPAGQRVITAAAFLTGLKTGITGSPWAKKRRHLDLLASLVIALQNNDPAVRERAACAFQTEPEETSSGLRFQLLWQGRELACWGPGATQQRQEGAAARALAAQAPAVTTTDPEDRMLNKHLPDTASGMNESASPTGGTCTALSVLKLHDGKVLELVQHDPATSHLVTLRYQLTDTDRLRKDKEILEVACRPGLLWRIGRNSDGPAALYADLPDIPCGETLRKLADTLEAALEQYLVRKKIKAKPARPAASRLRRKKETPELSS